MEEPSVILLDFWGVVGVVQTDQDLADMAAVIGVDPARFKVAYWNHRHFFDAGGDRDEYWRRVGADLGVDSTTAVSELAGLDRRSWSGVHTEMLDLIAQIAGSGRRMALLSNAPAELIDHASSVLEGLVPELMFSSRIGLAKPDPEIFELALRTLGVSAEEVLFIDDNADNIRAAQAAGMRTIHHVSVAQTRAELGLGE